MKKLLVILILFQVTASAQTLRFLGYFAPTNEIVTPTNWVSPSGSIRNFTNATQAYFGGIVAPSSSDGAALGTSSLMWSDAFLASGAVINFNNGDVLITHAANTLTFTGASSGYRFDAGVLPNSSDGAALGSTSLMWSDLFGASGFVLNFNNGDVALTHSANLLTLSGGDLSIPNLTLSGTITFPDNVRQTFNPGADAAGINVGSHAGQPGTPSNGDLIYNTSANALQARINGAWVSLGAGGGGDAPVGTMVNAGASTQYALPYYTDTTGTNLAPSLLLTDATLTNFYAGNFFIDTLIVTNDFQLAGDMFVGGSLTVTNGPIQPSANNVVGLGTATLSFADLFLASTAVINFGNGNVTITHAAGSITVAGATTFSLGTSAAFTTGTIELGAATDTTLARGAAGRLTVETVNVVTVSSVDDLTNKGYDAAGTGNTLKQTKQLILQRPDYGDGTGAVPQTNAFNVSGLMHYTFSGNAETNANWVVYEFDCPSDLDTTVAMTARFAFLSGGTDADDYVFHLTYDQVAPGTAYPTGTGVDLLPIVMTVTPTTPQDGDLQSSGVVTLTGWAAALTPGRAMQLRVARLQNGQDDGARDVQLVITYGSTL